MGVPWRAERVWEERVAVIVGGGASFTLSQARLIGMARAKDLVRVIAVNDAIYPCWFADIGYACDRKWWLYHGPLDGFLGKKLTLEEVAFHDVDHLGNAGVEGFSADPSKVFAGGNGVFQCTQIAVHCGVSKIIYVAVDMGGGHWFGEHPPGVANAPTNFQNRIASFAAISGELSRCGVVVVNASPASNLNVFPKVDLARALASLEATNGTEAREPARAAQA